MAGTQSGETRDAIDLLMDDHKRVQRIFDDFDGVDREDPEAVQELVETACMELQIHSILEEEIFYPAVRAQVEEDDQDTHDLLNRAEVEHETVDDLIAKLQELEPDDAMYAAYFKVLSEYVKHHVKEEEKELFPEAKRLDLDLQQLGEDMRTRREELFAEMEAEDSEEGGDGAEELDDLGEDTTADDADDDEESEDEQEKIIGTSRTRH
jgi:iron-sulfur cluster repair protein YtfE (RIC family)